METGRKASMSVPEMRKLLGLGKTESYYLVRKGYFRTVTAGKRMRVMTDSFEEWYAGQFHYRKVNGEPPGMKYRKDTFSIEEIAYKFNVNAEEAKEIIKEYDIPYFLVESEWRIPKTKFHDWLNNQEKFGEYDPDVRTISMPEAARLLGVNRSTIYRLAKEGYWEFVKVGRKRHITLQSFEYWYALQDSFEKISRTEEL